jgi:hypothetical protein
VALGSIFCLPTLITPYFFQHEGQHTCLDKELAVPAKHREDRGYTQDCDVIHALQSLAAEEQLS